MKLPLSLILLFFLVNVCNGYSQDYYKFKNYEMWNYDPSGIKYNIKTFSGSNLFEYLKIDPHYSIELKYLDKEGTYKTKWNDRSVDKQNGGIYSYELLNTYSQDDKNAILISLFFNQNTDKLIRVFYLFSKDGIKLGCYLYPEPL